MKKIFLSCLFFIAFIVLPSPRPINAQTSCSLEPTQIRDSDTQVTFKVGPAANNEYYKIEIDINPGWGCLSNIWSPPLVGSSGVVTHTFYKNVSCHDKIFATEPDNRNEIRFYKSDANGNTTSGAPLCKNIYQVNPAKVCQLSYTPTSIDASTNITVSGQNLPSNANALLITGPGRSNFPEAISLDPNGSFTKNVGSMPGTGSYQIQVAEDNPTTGHFVIGKCQPVFFKVGLPGQPVQNPGSGAGQAGQIAPTNLTGTRCGVGTIDTAVGCIPYTDTNSFIAWFLKWAIGIAGGIAFLMLIFSGFQIMTSSNNPQQLQTGRELLTAAVSGLILIVFSAFLLKLIGVDILGIPGLGNP